MLTQIRMAEIGRQIERARREAGLTKYAMAVALGVNPSTVYRWEKGLTEPSIVTMQRVCALTGKPMGWFIGESA